MRGKGGDKISDIIQNFLGNPLSVLILALIFFVVVVWFFQKKGKEKWFKPVPIENIIKEQSANLLKVVMIRGYWGYIRRGDISIGRILRVGKVNYIMENPNYKKPKKKKDKDDVVKDETKQKFIEKEIYIIKISFNPQAIFIMPFVVIMEFMGVGVKYAYVPAEHIDRFTLEGAGILQKNIDYLNINPKAEVFNVANVFIYGRSAFELVKEISWTYARKSELEELVNYPKRVVYLDTEHTKRTESYEEMDRIERKKFDAKIKHMTGDRP